MIKKGIREYKTLIRASEWADSKLPYFLFSVAALVALNGKIPGLSGFWFIQVNILFFASYLGSSYLINDMADRDIDLQAGKKKIIAGYSFPQTVIMLAATVAGGALPVLIVEAACGASVPSHIILIAGIYYLGFSYSIRPFRFKERGFAGTVFCSCAQRILPLAVAAAVFRVDYLLLAMLLIQGFMVGMRYILIHQLLDRKNDRETGVHTFSLHHPDAARKMIYVCVFFETVLIILLNLFLIRHGTGAAGKIFPAVTIIYFVLLAIFVRSVKYMLNERAFETFSFVPFEDYYNFFLPVCLFVSLLPLSPWYLIDILIVVLLDQKMLRVRAGFLSAYFSSLLRNRK